MACRLGSCALGDYRAIIRDRSGSEILELDFEQLDWERKLSSVSEATVKIPASCCGKLGGVRSWRHELSIARQGEEVWTGPVKTVSNCTAANGITLKAQDMLGWLERRIIHENHDWTPLPGIGSVQAAELLVIDGFAPDDPDVLRHLMTFGEGVISGRSYVANSKYVLDALTDLANGSLEFTTIGRRIILMENGWQLGRTTLINCEHFAGDVCTTEDGDGYTSRAVVTGVGVTGEAGGVDPYFGLVETLVDDQTIGRLATANGQAANLVTAMPPLLVQPPNGGALAPDTPLCLSELVPGVVVPTLINCTCRDAAQDMRLDSLSVSVTAAGESIKPLLTPFDSAN